SLDARVTDDLSTKLTPVAAATLGRSDRLPEGRHAVRYPAQTGGLLARRATGCGSNHRTPGGPAASGGATSARGGAAHAMLEPAQAIGPGDPPLRKRVRRLSPCRHSLELACRLSESQHYPAPVAVSGASERARPLRHECRLG